MRLAILGSRGIPARYGGFETCAEQLALGLSRAGVDVTVYCEHGSARLPAEQTYHGARLTYIRALRAGPLSTLLFDLACWWDARRRFDVVYMLGYGAAVFVGFPKLWGTKVWVNVDGLEWRRSKWGWLARLWLRSMEYLATRSADRIIADASAIEMYIRSRYKKLPPISCISYGANVQRLTPPSPTIREIPISIGRYHLVVCRFEPENHLLEIVQGYLQSGSSFPLLLVGNHLGGGAYSQAVREAAMPYEGRSIHFLGAIYESELLWSLRYHCCSYLHGHSVGGTNPSLLESMACGTPIIAHDNVFNREVAGDRALFFSTTPDIPERIQVAERLANTERNALRLAFQNRVQAHYSWEGVVTQYLALLRSIATEARIAKATSQN